MDEQAKQTPLVELLDAVPEDVRIGTQDGADWHAGTTWHPVGRLCRDAAAELRRLHAVNQELLKTLKDLTTAPNFNAYGMALYNARAAIAKAEGEKT
jgi:hypothetical protein